MMGTQTTSDFHNNLARYFGSKSLFSINFYLVNIRKIVEYPYQLMQSNQKEKLHIILTDFQFFLNLSIQSEADLIIYWKYINQLYDPYISYTKVWEKWRNEKFVSWQVKTKAAEMVGSLFEKGGQLHHAIIFFQYSLEEAIPHCGTQGITALQIYNRMGRTLSQNMELDKSSTILFDTLNSLYEKLGPSHILTLTTANDLGICYIKQNKILEAKVLYGWIINTIGLDTKSMKKDRLMLLRDYAIFLSFDNQIQQAIRILNDVINNLIIICEPSDYSLLDSKIDLASLYLSLDQYVETLSCLDGILKEIVEYYGIDHPFYSKALTMIHTSEGKNQISNQLECK